MIAVEFVTDHSSKAPATQAVDAIHRRAYERGLVLTKAADHTNIIRFLAPLTISDAELAEGLDILEEAIAEVAGELATA